MANVLVNDASLADIADAIREKNGTEETYKPSEMGDAVRAIESGGGGIGINYKEFTADNLPLVVDTSNIEKPSANINTSNTFYQMFSNASATQGVYVGMKDVYLPEWITHLSQEMFKNCVSLENIYGNLDNVVQIAGNAFQNCKALERAPKFLGLTGVLAGLSFNGCTSLKSFNFYKVPLSVSGTMFNNCTSLADIYVPWAEGAVENAPWGATNATIHYNTVYDENHEPIV